MSDVKISEGEKEDSRRIGRYFKLLWRSIEGDELVRRDYMLIILIVLCIINVGVSFVRV